MDHEGSHSADVIVLSLPASQYLSHAVSRVMGMLVARLPANRFAANCYVGLEHEDGHGEISVMLVSKVPFSAGWERLVGSLASLVAELERKNREDDRGASRVLRRATINGMALELPPPEPLGKVNAFTEELCTIDKITCTARFEFTCDGVGIYMPHSRAARVEVEVDGWAAIRSYLASGRPRLSLSDIKAHQLKSLFDAVEANLPEHFQILRMAVDNCEGLNEALEAKWRDGAHCCPT